MIRNWFLVIFCFLILNQEYLVAGSFIGNGADKLPYNHNAAWFLGYRDVRYCVVIDPNFSVGKNLFEYESDIVILDMLEEVFKQWKDYAVRKGYYNISNIAYYMNPAPPIAFGSIALDDCDGTEDLTFYFGTINKQISKDMAIYLQPVAFPKRTQWNEQLSWGKGYIWIAPNNYWSENYPNWERPNLLYGILLHDLGHVYGNGHVDGTIMTEKIETLYKNAIHDSQSNKKYFTNIDHSRELFFNWFGPFKYQRTFSSNSSDQLLFYRIFSVVKQLIGRDPVGPINISVNGKAFLVSGYSLFNHRNALLDPGRGMTIVISDDNNTYQFDVSIGNLISFSTGPVAFKKAFVINNLGTDYRTNTIFESPGQSYIGKATSLKGETITLIISRNMGRVPFTIFIVNDLEYSPIFIYSSYK